MEWGDVSLNVQPIGNYHASDYKISTIDKIRNKLFI